MCRCCGVLRVPGWFPVRTHDDRSCAPLPFVRACHLVQAHDVHAHKRTGGFGRLSSGVLNGPDRRGNLVTVTFAQQDAFPTIRDGFVQTGPLPNASGEAVVHMCGILFVPV